MESYGDYGDLLDDGPPQDVFNELTTLAFEAGRGAAALEAQQANSSDYWGDRILDAADNLASRDLWEPLEDEQ